MRAEELKTVSLTHKASVLCEHAQMGGAFHLNTDGTTIDQNGLVIKTTKLMWIYTKCIAIR